MLTMWGINSQAEQYVPGMIRVARTVEKVTSTKAVSSIKEHSEESAGNASGSTKSRVRMKYSESQEFTPKREPAILARQVMTSPVITIDVTSSMAEAWKLFHQRRFRHVPVVTNEERIVGILSDRDLWREAAGIHKHPTAASVDLSRLTVLDIMTDRVLTAHPDTEIRTIAQVLFEERIGAMPIVNDAGFPLGIMTRSDILRTVMNQVPFELWI